jgi:hypothetical protein
VTEGEAYTVGKLSKKQLLERLESLEHRVASLEARTAQFCTCDIAPRAVCVVHSHEEPEPCLS